MRGVFCYRNLNRKGVVWSVRSNRSGLVIRRSELVILRNVTLKVSQAGRKRVLRQKRKNVHAGATGILVSNTNAFRDTAWQYAWVRVKYDPYKAGYFVEESTGKKVTSARYLMLRNDGAWAAFPR